MARPSPSWDRYRGRWTTGTWFRTLKSGSRSRDRRLDTADGPPRCLASGAVTACRVADIAMPARERPDTPATEGLSGGGTSGSRPPCCPPRATGRSPRWPTGSRPTSGPSPSTLGRPRRGASHQAAATARGEKKVWQGLERLELGHPGPRRAQQGGRRPTRWGERRRGIGITYTGVECCKAREARTCRKRRPPVRPARP